MLIGGGEVNSRNTNRNTILIDSPLSCYLQTSVSTCSFSANVCAPPSSIKSMRLVYPPLMHSSANRLISILTFLSKVVQRCTKRKIRLDTILKKIIKRQLPFLIGGTITGAIMTYYYGFLFSIIVNSATWMLISFIVNKYYYKSTGFKDEKYLLQYGLAMINTRTRQS
jgi:hypothetical protein